jgi:uncharacterized protein with HEPN domain
MLDAIASARRYIEGFGRHEFLKDEKTQDAAILKLLVIGEAAAKISDEFPEFVARHPELPWKEMRGMRNRMVHGYFDINLEIVWDTLNESLPGLETKVERIKASALTEGEGRERGET